jgi:hypothetical protein
MFGGSIPNSGLAPYQVMMQSPTQKEFVDIYKDIQSNNREKEKLALEREKFALEKDKIVIQTLIEDFKARWQELLNFENENNRWSTLYVSAIVLVVSWILNHNEDNNKSLQQLYQHKENSYFVIFLAFINASYTLAMALKGYQIQQIALYLYSEIGKKISSTTGYRFNSWEKWRREFFQSQKRKGSPELVRVLYYSIISTLPTIVSFIILWLYWKWEWASHSWYGFRNISFYLVSMLVGLSLYAALSTTSINSTWKKVLAEEDKTLDTENEGKMSELDVYNAIRAEVVNNHNLMHLITMIVLILLLLGVAYVELKKGVLSILLPLLTLSWAAAMVRFDFFIHRQGAYLRALETSINHGGVKIPLWESWKYSLNSTKFVVPIADLLSVIVIIVPTVYLLFGPAQDFFVSHQWRGGKIFSFGVLILITVTLISLLLIPRIAGK